MIIDPVTATKAFQLINLAIEGHAAWNSIQSSLYAVQQKRLAEGRAITEADVDALMAQGDIKAAVEQTKLLAAKLAKAASLA